MLVATRRFPLSKGRSAPRVAIGASLRPAPETTPRGIHVVVGRMWGTSTLGGACTTVRGRVWRATTSLGASDYSAMVGVAWESAAGQSEAGGVTRGPRLTNRGPGGRFGDLVLLGYLYLFLILRGILITDR